jgi:hypothetical protein
MRTRLDISQLIPALTLIAVLAMAVRVPLSPDMWWQVRTGEVQWRARSVLRTDPFSHTALGVPWINHSWLPHLAMYGADAIGGLPGVALAVGLLITVTFAFVLANGRTEGTYGPFWRAAVVLWAAIASGRTWAARPHLATTLLTAIWVLLLDRQRRRTPHQIGVLWAFPPLMVLWANCHPGFMLGLALLAIEIGGRLLPAVKHRDLARLWADVRPLCIVAVLCAPATLLNPYGFGVIRPLFLTLGSSVQQSTITEWASPDFHALDMLPFLALLLATWSALAWSGSFAPVTWLRLSAFSALALRSGRNIGLCAIVAAPILIEHGERAWQRLRSTLGWEARRRTMARGVPLLNWAILALLLAAAGFKIALPLDSDTIAEVVGNVYPVDAVAYLAANDLPPTLFHDYGWGGYLIWALYPETRVFIDGRADMYGNDLLVSYQRAMAAQPGWEEVMDQYRVRTALIGRTTPLAIALRCHGAWQEVYADDMAAIFVREE